MRYFNDPQDEDDAIDTQCPECDAQMEVWDEGAYRVEYKCPVCGYRTANDNIDEIRDYLNDE